MADERVYDVAQSILDTLVVAFDDAGVLLPDRQYVHVGEVAYDCEQLVVTFTDMNKGLAAAPETTVVRWAHPTIAGYEIHLVRCVPGIDEDGVPTVSELEAAALQTGIDSWLVGTTLPLAVKAKTFPPTPCQLVALGELVVNGPLGNMVGVSLPVDVGLV